MHWVGLTVREVILSGPVLAGLAVFALALLAALRRWPAEDAPDGPSLATGALMASLDPSQPADELLAAIEMAARDRSREAVPALVRLLDSSDGGVSGAAAHALGEIGDEAALPHLLARQQETAGDADQETGGRAGDHATSGPTQAPGPAASTGGTDGGSREAIEHGAGDFAGPAAGSAGVETASRTGGGLGSDTPAGTLLWGDASDMQPRMDRALSRAAGRQGEALLALSRSTELAPVERYFALRNLGLSDAGAFEDDVIALALDAEALVRLGAVAVLETLGSATARDALVAATFDPVAMVRARALLALSGADPSEARLAIERLAQDGDAGVRDVARRLRGGSPSKRTATP